MTCRVHCYQCGTVLYEGRELKPPYEIVRDHEGRCPNCHRKLSDVPLTVDVIRNE